MPEEKTTTCPPFVGDCQQLIFNKESIMFPGAGRIAAFYFAFFFSFFPLRFSFRLFVAFFWALSCNQGLLSWLYYFDLTIN